MTLTYRQTQYVDRVIDEENATKYRSISPGICGSCPQCQSHYGMTEEELTEGYESGEVLEEGGFSYHDCEVCGCPLGGDRCGAHGWTSKNELLHYDICQDCLFYLANGEVPDASSNLLVLGIKESHHGRSKASNGVLYSFAFLFLFVFDC